jgi:ABC-type glycerol-3-phosphate transport system substrate-binding protein
MTMVLLYLPFISFAPPKETKQRKEAFLYEFFDNEVKNRFQNFASLRAFAPVLKAFENYSTPQEFFTAWGLDYFFLF